jgi:hypothetical protein
MVAGITVTTKGKWKMSEAVFVAVLSLIGTLGGTFGGIITANKLTVYRLQQLEKKVEEHNNLVTRMYAVEKHEAVIDEEIEQLKNYHK